MTDEHIVPDGLGARKILPRASCGKCQKIINEEFEQYCLRTMLHVPRTLLGMRSSRKRPAVPTSLLIRRSDGTIERVSRTADDMPLAVSLPAFPLPAGLLGVPTPDIIDGAQWSSEPASMLEKLGAEAWCPGPQDVSKFARFLAKMAHCEAFASGPPGWFNPVLPSVILGTNTHWNEYVGGSLELRPADNATLFEMAVKRNLRHSDHQLLVLVQFRFFPNLGGPDYVVVAGECLMPEHVPT